MNIQDKTILITGANRGIGKSFVESFLAAGAAKVYAAVRKPESAQPLVEKYGDRVVPIRLDLQDEQSINAAAQTASDVDIVVNNGGVLEPFDALDKGVFGDIDYSFDINVKGLLRMAQAFAPVLKANGGGVFAQLNSVASLTSFPAFSSYCASKAAAYSFTIALRASLAEQGTQVISIHPGPIATDMAHDAGLTEIAEPPSVVADALIKAIETGEFHVFPDTMARQMGEAYAPFASNVVLAEPAEA